MFILDVPGLRCSQGRAPSRLEPGLPPFSNERDIDSASAQAGTTVNEEQLDRIEAQNKRVLTILEERKTTLP